MRVYQSRAASFGASGPRNRQTDRFRLLCLDLGGNRRICSERSVDIKSDQGLPALSSRIGAGHLALDVPYPR